MSSNQTFEIGIYRGGERVGNIRFNINSCDTTGDVEFWSFETELSKHLIKALDGKRHWKWESLTTRLSQELTMSTGGRFILRYGVTPSSAGRGEDQLRQQINRTVKEVQ